MAGWTVQILGLIIIAVIGTIFMHIGAKLAGISNATIMKAFEVALIGVILYVILNSITSIAGLIGFILLIAVIKYIYNTSWGKAIVAWILFIIVIIVVIIILVTILGVTILSLFG